MGAAGGHIFELIEASITCSGVAEYKNPSILSQDYSPNFPLKLIHKDMPMMMDAVTIMWIEECAGLRLKGKPSWTHICGVGAKRPSIGSIFNIFRANLPITG